MNEHRAVLDLAQRYLRSIHEGSPEGLREVFHPGARIEDALTGTLRSRDVDQYIQTVASRQSPHAAGEPFHMAPISIAVLGDIATVTAELSFLGNHFHNVLSLLRCDGQWRIMHKLFGERLGGTK